MKTFQISKYNPKYRNKEGGYIKNEWMSVSDINKKFDDGILNSDEYMMVENNYLNALRLIISELQISKLKIVQLQKFDETLIKKPFVSYDEKSEMIFNDVKEGKLLNIDDALRLLRLIIRENIWCYLISDDITINVGYDYYLNVSISKKLNCFKTIEANLNLFIVKLGDYREKIIGVLE